MLGRRIKRIAIFGLVLSAMVLAGVLLLPTVMGTKWIYQPLVDRLAADDFDLTIESVRLRWFSPLKFERVYIKEKEGLGLISIAEIRSDRGLFGYLLGGRQLGRIEIVRPTVDAKLLSDSSNLDRLIKAIEGRSKASANVKKKEKPRFDVEVAIIGGSAKIQRENEPEPLVVIPPFDLNLQYLAAKGPSRLRIAPTQVLKQVELTPELIELGLGYAVPLLAESAWFDGKVSLDIDQLNIPLDEPIQSSGNAVLTLHTVRSGPAQPDIVNLLDFIAKLRRREPQHELVFVDGSQITIGMKDAQVTHSGLQVGLPRMDSRLQFESAGSVGLLDKQLAMNLEVPIPLQQLAQREQVKSLGVPKLTIPISGTLDDPVVDWDVFRIEGADLLGLMRRETADEAPITSAALGAAASLASGELDGTIAAGIDLFRELQQKRKEAKEADQTPPKSESDLEPRRPVFDALRNIIRGKKDEP